MELKRVLLLACLLAALTATGSPMRMAPAPKPFRWGDGGWGKFGGHPGNRVASLAAKMLGSGVVDASGAVVGDVNATGVVLLAVYNYSGDYNIRYGVTVRLTDAGAPTGLTINSGAANATGDVVIDFATNASTWTNMTWNWNASAPKSSWGRRSPPPLPKYFGFFRPANSAGYVYGFASVWYNSSTISSATGTSYKDLVTAMIAAPDQYYAIATSDKYPNGVSRGQFTVRTPPTASSYWTRY